MELEESEDVANLPIKNTALKKKFYCSVGSHMCRAPYIPVLTRVCTYQHTDAHTVCTENMQGWQLFLGQPNILHLFAAKDGKNK